MNKFVAVLISGLIAGSAFAQTASTATKVAPAVASTAAKADAKEVKALHGVRAICLAPWPATLPIKTSYTPVRNTGTSLEDVSPGDAGEHDTHRRQIAGD